MSDARADDAALIGRIASGDKAAFATIYDRHLPLVLRWSFHVATSGGRDRPLRVGLGIAIRSGGSWVALIPGPASSGAARAAARVRRF
jgi:hypothetical protein